MGPVAGVEAVKSFIASSEEMDISGCIGELSLGFIVVASDKLQMFRTDSSIGGMGFQRRLRIKNTHI